MKKENIKKAIPIFEELEIWESIKSRMDLGNGYYRIYFEGFMTEDFSKMDVNINDTTIIETYKKFVESKITECEKKLEEI